MEHLLDLVEPAQKWARGRIARLRWCAQVTDNAQSELIRQLELLRELLRERTSSGDKDVMRKTAAPAQRVKRRAQGNARRESNGDRCHEKAADEQAAGVRDALDEEIDDHRHAQDCAGTHERESLTA